MVTNTQNIIRTKYSNLIQLISQISDDVRIEDRWSRLSLTIDVYNNKRRLLSLKLYQLSETGNDLSVEWGVLGYNIGHWCFPDYFTQKYIFDKLICIIIDWYQNVINSNLGTILKQAQDNVINESVSSEK